MTDRPITCTALDDTNRGWAHRHFRTAWSSMLVARKRELVDATSYPGFVAELDGEPAGLLVACPRGAEYEVLSISVTVEGLGLGRALLTRAFTDARERRCRRVWLTTTNDNIRAIGFYQRLGMSMCGLDLGAVGAARALKPTIPMRGFLDIAVEHELELELLL